MEVAWVGLLEPGGAAATIRLGAQHFGPGDADLIHFWCGSHSFFLQLFGSFLVEARRSRVSPDQATAEFQRQAPIHFRQLWKTVPQAQQQAPRGLPASVGVLKQRGLVNEKGGPFGEVFAAWLRGEIGS
jgi:hypothetical protein